MRGRWGEYVLIGYYCALCKKDIADEKMYTLTATTGIGFTEVRKTLCKDWLRRINTYIDRILRVTNNK